MKCDIEKIQTKSWIQNAIVPPIISASRSTDIPALYSEWLINRLRAGYCIWINPFNQGKQYISFKNTKIIVFWTKNPAPLIPLLSQIDDLGISYYFQFTLNNYVAEKFEPGIPSLEERIETFLNLSEIIGKDKIIWRFDPIIFSSTLSSDCILERISVLANILQNYTNKLVFSFADIMRYKHVSNNIRILDKSIRELTAQEMVLFADCLSKINANLSIPLSLATCAEHIDLSFYGIEHNKCIDNKLITKILPHFNKDPDRIFS
ncbi:MAG: DUF1848 domain-containing protein, partial [Bacteroidales bacterium]|nr:DUF1848 domain-containing protein [Bacteroidales bacterium]